MRWNLKEVVSKSLEDTEEKLEEAKARKRTIESEKLSGDNVYKLLIHFDKIYDKMDDEELK